MTTSAFAGGPPAMWRRQSPLLRRAVMALSISAILLILAATGHIQRSKELALIVAVVLLAFLARAIYVGFLLGLERVGVSDARDRWEHQSPFLQRAVLPLVIAAIVIAVVWAVGLAPDPSLLVLLAITYALYLMPRSWRRIAVPVVALTLAALYPYFIQQANYQTFLFKLPVFTAFPSMDTMFDIIVFGMMAIGLNMVVGYAGLLDLGYVAFYAIGAYTAAWLA